jgi:hypothetical protein
VVHTTRVEKEEMLAAVRRMMLAAATAALLHAREMVRTVKVQATACPSGGCVSVCRSVVKCGRLPTYGLSVVDTSTCLPLCLPAGDDEVGGGGGGEVRFIRDSERESPGERDPESG